MAKKNQPENRLVVTAKIRAAIEAYLNSLVNVDVASVTDIEPAVQASLKGVKLPVGSVKFQLTQMVKNNQVVVQKEGRYNWYKLAIVRKAASKKIADLPPRSESQAVVPDAGFKPVQPLAADASWSWGSPSPMWAPAPAISDAFRMPFPTPKQPMHLDLSDLNGTIGITVGGETVRITVENKQ